VHIDEEACIGCGSCVPYCPMDAIAVRDEGVAQINHDECVECGVCLRSAGCPADAIVETLHPWPRSVRAAFSNPLFEHKETRIPGRGTEEMKTNDVTGRFRRGCVGVAIELGRPGIGTRFRDVQKVARAVAEFRVPFERQNPVTFLMTNKETGDMNPEALNEKVLSAIVEFTVANDELPAVLNRLREVAEGVEAVFSVDLICRVEPDGLAPTVLLTKDVRIAVSVNGKTNCGMGRPLAVEVAS
jgi:ferredoxin